MTAIPPSPEFLALQRAVAGRYSLVRELGRGGMGIVYLARDVALDRLVAIKLLPPTLSAQPEWRERFVREARIAASLAHPHIVPIHLVETRDDLVYFVMACVDGETLGERVRRRGPLPAAAVMRLVQEVAWALGHAHARGIFHRDVKPDNILLDRESGRAMVTDFGIAVAAQSETPGAAPRAGTAHYVSPEIVRGERADGRADLYALGVTAWYALTGTHPFEGSSAAQVWLTVLSEPAPPLAARAPGVPARFARAIDRCLARDPGDRWPGAEAMAEEIDAARARVPALPGPVRAFVNEAIPAGDVVASGLAAAVSVAGVLLIIGRGGGFNDLFATAALLPVAAVSLGIAVMRIGSVGIAARDLVEEGYDFQAARAGLVRADAEREEEQSDRPRPERLKRAGLYLLTGLVKEAFAIWLAMHQQAWIWLPGAALAVLIPPFAARTLWRMLHRGPSLWTRLLQGRFGRAMFRVADMLVRRRKTTDVAASTVAALGSDAEGVFLRLPRGVRDDLGDVPRLLAELGRKAQVFRARRDDPAAAERLATAAAAMEAVRLDLLSLEAGLASIPDVTRHLDEAMRLAARIDQVLAGRDAAASGAPAAAPTPV